MANGNGNGYNGSKNATAVMNILLVILAAILTGLFSLLLDIRSDVRSMNTDIKSNSLKNVEQDGKLNQYGNDHLQFREDLRELKSYHKK